jgi:hypothetical protein
MGRKARLEGIKPLPMTPLAFFKPEVPRAVSLALLVGDILVFAVQTRCMSMML